MIHMYLYIADAWLFFCIAFGMMLLTSFIMSIQSVNFYTYDVVRRKFSIIDLELPASPVEVVNLIKGVYKLPVQESQKTLKALRAQLYTDFLFMPAAYISIFLLCMQVSLKMVSFGHSFFAMLAWLQIIPWICDIIENVYLLHKINPDVVSSGPAVHKAYQFLEILKWGTALSGAIIGIAAIIYFWLIGNYSITSLKYLLIITAEIISFLIAGKIAVKRSGTK